MLFFNRKEKETPMTVDAQAPAEQAEVQPIEEAQPAEQPAEEAQAPAEQTEAQPTEEAQVQINELEELKKQYEELKAQNAAAEHRAEEAQKALDAARADAAIERAVRDGHLLPGQVADGSPWVGLAHNDPALFEQLIGTLGASSMPVEPKLSKERAEGLEDPVSKYRKLVESGMSPDLAFNEVSR